ncbi:sugar transferase [Terribacillus saccharophilus]|uniref:sugar transferase n=1 Tax=Terribacillus saccharophilus TaxID=361277 RepID=UPI000C9C2BF4|nr:sugar transferase [Terribacillus goriensis]MEC0282044.1 sugar transferase [Terribacillus saccharophilus]MEC0291167.1 sugar transferase [Terribacillus saccharophilus]
MAESKQQQQIYKAVEANTVVISERKAYLITKRTIDIFLSLIGIILLLPVLLLIAIFIKLEDKKGSIIFKQERVGIHGKTFYMYKFRSMVSNAEELLKDLIEQNEASGPLFKMKEDPRVTKIGRFLRKTSLDELPQLINVIKGEMSLVGPRPALPKEVETYTSFERQRLEVTPGLTCFWQVEGRSNIGFEEQVQLDLKYIEKRSFKTDISLIIRTIKVLFGSNGAF